MVLSLVWIGHTPPAAASDWDFIYVGARAVIHGTNPYIAVEQEVEAGRLLYPLSYPATAPVLMAPLGALPQRLATSIFTALGMAVLAWSLSRERPWRLWMLVSAPAVHAVLLGQWSPWLTAAVGLPWLGLVWAAKPSTGLALFVGWPSRRAAFAAAVLLALTFALFPRWPLDWMASLRGAPYYLAPVQRPGGVLLLLAFLRWRQPEGRMLGTLALVPHTTVLHEMLAPLLVARTRVELAWLMAFGYLAAYLVYTRTTYGSEVVRMLTQQWPYFLALVYLPALVIVLRRPGPGCWAREPSVNYRWR